MSTTSTTSFNTSYASQGETTQKSAVSSSIIPYNPEATSQEKAIEKMAETAAISDDLFEKALNTYELQSEEKNSTIRELGEMNIKLQANLEAMEGKYQELLLLYQQQMTMLNQQIQHLSTQGNNTQQEISKTCDAISHRQEQQEICVFTSRLSLCLWENPLFEPIPKYNFPGGSGTQLFAHLSNKLDPANRARAQLLEPLSIFSPESCADAKSIQDQSKDLNTEIQDYKKLLEQMIQNSAHLQTPN